MAYETETVQTVDREKLVRDIKEVIHDAEVLIKATAGDLSEKAKEAREKLSVKIGDAKAQLGEWQAVAKEKAIAGAKQADETIRSHPYESIAVAFGVGLLVGIIANRK
jgi:ElaB/YqjD/DUF883 family membrane-anchored ribosome-binding protein